MWAQWRKDYEPGHVLRGKIQTELRADDSGGIRGSMQRNDTKSDLTSGGFYPRCYAVTWGSMSHCWGIMCWAAWDQRNTGLQLGLIQKETSKGPHSQPCPSSTKPQQPLLLHPFIASFLPCSLKVSLLWPLLTEHRGGLRGCNAEREEEAEPPCLFLPVHWSCHHPDADFSKWPLHVCWWDPHNSSFKGDCLSLLPKEKSFKLLSHYRIALERSDAWWMIGQRTLPFSAGYDSARE